MFETTELNKFGFHLHDEKIKTPLTPSPQVQKLKC